LATVEERRRAERVPINIPIELRNGTGITRDVSGLGVYFTSPFPFERDEQVDCILRIPGAIDVHCSGRVVRSEYDREAMRYGVAMTIDSFDVSGTDLSDATASHLVLRELRKHHGS
jgi:hypothetical protein